MKMFGILSVQRAPLPGEPGTVVLNCVHGTGDVTSRGELFDQFVGALPAEWQGTLIVRFFYAEPDDLSDDGDGRFSTPAHPTAKGGAR